MQSIVTRSLEMIKKRRLLVIWGSMPPSIGGGSARGYRILKALGERGYSVSAFVQKPDGTKTRERISSNFEIIRVPPSLRKLSRRWSLSWFLAVATNIIRYCNLYIFLLYFYLKNKPDIILRQIPSWESDSKVLKWLRLGISPIAPWVLLKKISHAPLLVYFCNLLNMSKRRALMSSYSANKVIVLDKWMENDLKGMGIEDPMCYLPVCIDTRVFRPGQKIPMNNVLFIGRLDPETGCDTFLKAVPEIVEDIPDCKITIIGTGSEMSTLQEMAKQMNIMSHVVFAGPVEHDQTHIAYDGAKVLANPSRVQNIGNITIEAMACGIPVVKSFINGYPNYPIDDGVNGYSFKMNDCHELANRVVEVLQNPHWEIMSKAARETAKGFDIQSSVDKLEQIIESAIHAGIH